MRTEFEQRMAEVRWMERMPENGHLALREMEQYLVQERCVLILRTRTTSRVTDLGERVFTLIVLFWRLR